MSEIVEHFPEEGELILATVNKISQHGVYVSLDEYDNSRGFLHKSEISTGWVKHIEKFVQLGQKRVFKVIRRDIVRQEIDLSLRQVTREETKLKIISFKHEDKAIKIFENVAKHLNTKNHDLEKYKNLVIDEFESLYTACQLIVEKDVNILNKLDLPDKFIKLLITMSNEKIKAAKVNIKYVLTLSSDLSNGVDVIKNALSIHKDIDLNGSTFNITTLGSPNYLLIVHSAHYKEAEKIFHLFADKLKKHSDKHKIRFTHAKQKN